MDKKKKITSQIIENLKKTKNELRKSFEKRWLRNFVNRKTRRDLPLPNKEDVWNLVQTSYIKGFKCEYCGIKMLIKDTKYPYFKSYTIEHKIALEGLEEGDHSIENLTIACNGCNVLKSTMTAETYKKLCMCVDTDLLNQIKKEMCKGGQRRQIVIDQLVAIVEQQYKKTTGQIKQHYKKTLDAINIYLKRETIVE